jgi:hypothetical protein
MNIPISLWKVSKRYKVITLTILFRSYYRTFIPLRVIFVAVQFFPYRYLYSVFHTDTFKHILLGMKQFCMDIIYFW